MPELSQLSCARDVPVGYFKVRASSSAQGKPVPRQARMVQLCLLSTCRDDCKSAQPTSLKEALVLCLKHLRLAR